MGIQGKAKNISDQATGKAREVTGVVTGNRDLQYRGQAEQILAHLRQAGEKIKDAFRI